MTAEQLAIKEALDDFDMAQNIITAARAKLLKIYSPPEKTDQEKAWALTLEKNLLRQKKVMLNRKAS